MHGCLETLTFLFPWAHVQQRECFRVGRNLWTSNGMGQGRVLSMFMVLKQIELLYCAIGTLCVELLILIATERLMPCSR